jgi:hypothetical protein
MRREQMDSAIRYMYLFQSFVVPRVPIRYWAPFWRISGGVDFFVEFSF